MTAWRHDPWSRASWAVVPPGFFRSATAEGARGERIWFAGEALSRAAMGHGRRRLGGGDPRRGRDRASALVVDMRIQALK